MTLVNAYEMSRLLTMARALRASQRMRRNETMMQAKKIHLPICVQARWVSSSKDAAESRRALTLKGTRRMCRSETASCAASVWRIWPDQRFEARRATRVYTSAAKTATEMMKVVHNHVKLRTVAVSTANGRWRRSKRRGSREPAPARAAVELIYVDKVKLQVDGKR